MTWGSNPTGDEYRCHVCGGVHVDDGHQKHSGLVRFWRVFFGPPKCRHEFTVWAPDKDYPDQWRRVCTKCKFHEERRSEEEPET